MHDVSKIGPEKYEAKRFSYEAVILCNAISDDSLKNSESVDEKNLRKYFYFSTLIYLQ